MFPTLKKLGGLSSVYAIGNLITKGVAFLLLPLYTQYLQPADYGILAIVTMVSSVLGFFMPLGMTGVVNRFHFQFDDNKVRKNFYGAIWAFLITIGLTLTLFLNYTGELIFSYLFDQTPFSPFIQIAIFIAFLNTAFILMPTQMLRVEERALAFISFRFLQFFGTVGFTIWFVVYLELGAVGAAIAQLFGVMLAALAGIFFLVQNSNMNFNWVQIRPALAYGLPLIPHFVSHWVLNASDRAILERNVPLAQVGVYSMGYQVGTILQIVSASINSAIVPIYSKAVKDKETFKSIPRIASYFVLFASIVTIGFVLVADLLIIVATPTSYHDAIHIVPWVSLAYFALSIYFLGVNALGPLSGHSKPIPIATTFAAIINILINIFFIPRFGIVVAAISTTISYVFLALIVHALVIRLNIIKYENDRLIKLFLATSCCVGIKIWVLYANLEGLYYWLSELALLTTYVFVLLTSSFFLESEKELAKKQSQKIYRVILNKIL